MPSGVFDSILLRDSWSTEELRRVFSDENRVQKWYEVEAMLASEMASEAQIRANRLNALKSTGPKTPCGKSMMRRNAFAHGMTAAHVVLFDEVRSDFEKFYAGLSR